MNIVQLKLLKLKTWTKAILTCFTKERFGIESGFPVFNLYCILALISAYAQRPFVQIEQCYKSTETFLVRDKEQVTGLCFYPIYRQDFQLQCNVKGARPNISSLHWLKNDQQDEVLHGVILSIEDGHYGTFTTTATVLGNVSSFLEDVNLTCAATGIAVNGTARQTIVVIPVKIPGNIKT